MKINTRVIHGGVDGDEATGAVSVPIHQASTFAQSAPGKHSGYEYARTGNPTRHALEELVADLEGGHSGFAFSSGMAAITAVLMLFQAGDHLIIGDDVYGGTFRLIDKVFRKFGLDFTFIDPSDPENLLRALKPNTKAVYLETPTNPLMKLADISSVAAIARASGLLVIVDNTFMTPYLQRPLALGADIVIHSATKYLGGHSDLVAGVVVVSAKELAERVHFLQNSTGAILGPNDSWLLIRGIKTLAVRMDRHCRNARTAAQWLQNQNWVEKVYYPGFDPARESLKNQMSGYGGMLSFLVKSPLTVKSLVTGLSTITLAESLGGVESLLSIPAAMTHASIPAERRRELGIAETLVRLSVGIEDVEDIIADLDIRAG